MKRLFTTLMWDLRLQTRHHILTITGIVTLMYVLVFWLLPVPEWIVALLIFSDPAMLGFMFIGALVLFEKGANTLPALVVTPIHRWQYVWAKAISLTLIALPASCVMAIAGHGWNLQYGYLVYAVVCSSIIFVLLGFAGAARVQTLNQYLISIPAMLLPLCLPLLNFIGLTETYWFYLSPAQAGLILLNAAFAPAATGDLLYALLYLPTWVVIACFLADQAFLKYIIRG